MENLDQIIFGKKIDKSKKEEIKQCTIVGGLVSSMLGIAILGYMTSDMYNNANINEGIKALAFYGAGFGLLGSVLGAYIASKDS